MRSRGAIALLAVVLVLALSALGLSACGGIAAPDLFIVQRSGGGPHAKLTLLVNEEGGVSCNGLAKRGGRKLKLSDPMLVQARAIQEDLQEPAREQLSLSPRPGSVLSYSVRDENGTVRFSDNSPGQPKVLRELALFVLQAAQRVCGLPE
ncbi:MAG TPA: hypothetical protein VHW67_04315 [Solirubrobacteraceae bacterium]|jgi:hypothetical protein|nr:hypothetical protein [Solirubrobacteraceae bacterium]